MDLYDVIDWKAWDPIPAGLAAGHEGALGVIGRSGDGTCLAGDLQEGWWAVGVVDFDFEVGSCGEDQVADRIKELCWKVVEESLKSRTCGCIDVISSDCGVLCRHDDLSCLSYKDICFFPASWKSACDLWFACAQCFGDVHAQVLAESPHHSLTDDKSTRSEGVSDQIIKDCIHAAVPCDKPRPQDTLSFKCAVAKSMMAKGILSHLTAD